MTRDYRDALDGALRAALDAGADDVEVSYAGGRLYFARFASSRFTQVGAVTRDDVRVRALIGRRLGAQMCGTLDGGALAVAARGAVEAARQAPELDVALAFTAGPGESVVPAEPAVHDALAPGEAPSTLGRAFELARASDCRCAGALKVARRRLAVRTAAGVRRDHAWGRTDLQLIAQANDGDSSGFCGHAAASDRPVDIDRVAASAIDKAARGRKAHRIDAGELDVVLAPAAVAELLEWMSIASFGAQAVLDGESLLTDRAGAPVCDERITVTDRPIDERAFDAEGRARRAVTLIDRGRAGRPLTDLTTALRLGDDRGSTGHAAPLVADTSEPAAAHLHLSPGERDEQALIGEVDRGLYVTRLHYVNGLLDTRRAVTTGMTRDGTFEIVGGKLAGGVRNLRFTDSVLDAWGPRLGDVGREPRTVPTWWSTGGLLTVPALLVRGFRFTGQSR